MTESLAQCSHAACDESPDLKAMIKANLVAERVAIESYRQIIALIGDRDSTTRRLLEDILSDELVGIAAAKRVEWRPVVVRQVEPGTEPDFEHAPGGPRHNEAALMFDRRAAAHAIDDAWQPVAVVQVHRRDQRADFNCW